MNPRVAHLVPSGVAFLSSDDASDSSGDCSCGSFCAIPTEIFSLESDVSGTTYCFLAASAFAFFGELDFFVANVLPFFCVVGIFFPVNCSFPSSWMVFLLFLGWCG